jgi:hypothetical protein
MRHPLVMMRRVNPTDTMNAMNARNTMNTPNAKVLPFPTARPPAVVHRSRAAVHGARHPSRWVRPAGADVQAGWAVRADAVLDAAEQLLAAGEASDVVKFCEYAIRCVETSAADIDDTRSLVRLARRLGELQVRAGAAARRGQAG